jgi:methanogenic corrinoid protein MtbC1
VPAQQEVGRRWQRNEWTVAKEHTATAVVDAIVGVLGLRASRTVRERPTGDPVLVVCAEEEWHTLMARLVAEGLRAEGWPVHLLGGSVPAAHLGQAVREGPWAAAIVCCAVPMFLGGARRSIAAVREAGVPVLATGRGFGPDGDRARRLGADAWAADLSSGLLVLTAWEAQPPALPGAPTPPAEVAELAAAAAGLVDAACDELAGAWPPFTSLDATAIERTREDFAYLLRFLEAAVLTGDDRVLVDYVEWLGVVLSSRGVPPEVVPLTLRCLQRALPPGFRAAHDALLRATA